MDTGDVKSESLRWVPGPGEIVTEDFESCPELLSGASFVDSYDFAVALNQHRRWRPGQYFRQNELAFQLLTTAQKRVGMHVNTACAHVARFCQVAIFAADFDSRQDFQRHSWPFASFPMIQAIPPNLTASKSSSKARQRSLVL